jgi:hypothetical protein
MARHARSGGFDIMFSFEVDVSIYTDLPIHLLFDYLHLLHSCVEHSEIREATGSAY